jgi:hypothetical protein
MLPTTRLLRPARSGLRHLLQSLVLAVAATLVPASAALAEKGLPKPYVSPALDAVLLPITAEVRKEFKLGKKAAGLVIVSVDPGGVGELYGLEPGEVITELDDKALRRPVDLDSMIRYKLKAGTNYFFFEGTWKNKKKKTIVELTNEDYEKPVALENVSKWRAYNTGGSKSKAKRGNGYRGDDGYYYTGGGFYYYDFCDSYYDDFYQVYDYTLIYVEEVIVTEVYITSIESSETYFYYDDAAAGYDWPEDDYYIDEVDAYYSSDEFYAEYESTDYYYEDEAYDPETGLSYEEAEAYGYLDPVPEGYSEDPDSGSGYDETAADEGYVDDGSGYDEPLSDEGYVDDGSDYVDDGSGYEEPVYEETYEEPAYEETYEEPVYEETYEEPAYEETYEEPVYEETYEEPAYEETYEEPVYEETYEEPAYEETYEEPVYEETYEEPVYEEPSYEDSGGGGDCYVDESGYEVCG